MGYLSSLDYTVSGNSRTVSLSASATATLQASGETGRVNLTSGSSTVTLDAFDINPSYYESDSPDDERLYTNAGIVTEGSANRFAHNVYIGTTYDGQRNDDAGLAVGTTNLSNGAYLCFSGGVALFSG